MSPHHATSGAAGETPTDEIRQRRALLGGERGAHLRRLEHADDAMATRLAEISAKEWKRPGIGGTPSFAINGVVMPGTHTWPALERQLKEFL